MAQKSGTIAVINSNNQILLLRRGSTAPWQPSKYCLPGGGKERDETLEHCAIRELFEETGIVANIETIKPNIIRYKNENTKIVFSIELDNPPVILNWEHDGYIWVDRQSFKFYNLVPGLYTTITQIFGD